MSTAIDEISLPGAAVFPEGITADPDGVTFYVSSSRDGTIFRVSLEDEIGEPEEWTDLAAFGAPPDASFLNGIIPAVGGSVLLISAQEAEVLWRVDIATRTAEPVDLGADRVAADGLEFVGDVLYACDVTEDASLNVHFWLTAVNLDDDARSGRLAGRWQRRIEDTPTTLAYLACRLYVVNSQFHADRQGTQPGPFTVSVADPPLS